jgi:hypothetical protein
MIKLIEIKTGSAFWEIDGVILRFQRKKSIGDVLTEQCKFLIRLQKKTSNILVQLSTKSKFYRD